MSSTNIYVTLNPFLKLGTALLIGLPENCPISSPVLLLIQKLFSASDKAFKKLYIAPPI